MYFSKMHGLGNDFVVIDAVNQKIELSTQDIIEISNRHTGIGFDQLLIVRPSKRLDCDFEYQIFNADGSQVGQCGNGARALTKFIVEKNLSSKKQLKLYTQETVLECEYRSENSIRVNMGVPKFIASAIPMIADHENGPFSLMIIDEQIDFSAVNIGNPHIVISVLDLPIAPVLYLGEKLVGHSRFPEGVNVGFMQVNGQHDIILRVYERGVGETAACGSGACAAAVTGILSGVLSSPVNVTQAGGVLNIVWDGPGHLVLMEGPATWIFDGMVETIGNQ